MPPRYGLHLENHQHLIAQSPDLPAEIGSFKAWTAKRLLEVLQEQRAERILKQLAFYKKAHKTDRCYQDWEEGSHPEQIQNPAMMLQKIEYIHQNPVKRGYVDNPAHWRNSSARNYARENGVLKIDREWYVLIATLARLSRHSHAARGNEMGLAKFM